jgi:hypothetical protein
MRRAASLGRERLEEGERSDTFCLATRDHNVYGIEDLEQLMRKVYSFCKKEILSERAVRD